MVANASAAALSDLVSDLGVVRELYREMFLSLEGTTTLFSKNAPWD